jgi:hypothetical protein
MVVSRMALAILTACSPAPLWVTPNTPAIISPTTPPAW